MGVTPGGYWGGAFMCLSIFHHSSSCKEGKSVCLHAREEEVEAGLAAPR